MLQSNRVHILCSLQFPPGGYRLPTSARSAFRRPNAPHFLCRALARESISTLPGVVAAVMPFPAAHHALATPAREFPDLVIFWTSGISLGI